MYLYSDDDYSTARSGTLSDFFLSLSLSSPPSLLHLSLPPSYLHLFFSFLLSEFLLIFFFSLFFPSLLFSSTMRSRVSLSTMCDDVS